MRARRKVLLVAALVAGYFIWVSRPEFSDRAELTDTCSFPTITNEQYRALIVEAKKLIEPNHRRIADGDGNIKQGAFNPPLGDLTLEFLKQSRSTEEAFARIFAFGRALEGRVENVAPAVETFAGPWGRWVDRDSAGNRLSSPRFLLHADFQGPPGLFRYPIGTLVVARAVGRRYEGFWLGVWFEAPGDVRLEDALIGPNVVDASARKAMLVYPLLSTHWGETRLEQRCPNAERFLSHATSPFKRRKN